ncbi:MAG: hypothetical protein GY854_17335, partial [Deltaproteobacteria bacterium]|nr:hypothetical protein [Deltaproteobacteria bacterium]
AGSDSYPGTSWTDALASVQEGIIKAVEIIGDVTNGIHSCEVWVASLPSGYTYPPTKDSSGDAFPTNPRTKTFWLSPGIAMFGGLDGTETALEDRESTNPTVLSGDIGDAGDNTDNAYHVVTGADSSAINGFTIANGNANGSAPNDSGGGMYNDSSNLIVTNCIFETNSASGNGGGMYNDSSQLAVTNCIFNKNTAGGRGGGVANNLSSSQITNCTFWGNTATTDGGGIYNEESSSTVSNTILWGDVPNEIFN